jgi:hypothetical protein
MVAGRIALWDQASLTESNKLHPLPSKLLSYSHFHPSPPKQFSAVCIMSIDGQTPLELVDRVIADNNLSRPSLRRAAAFSEITDDLKAEDSFVKHSRACHIIEIQRRLEHSFGFCAHADPLLTTNTANSYRPNA